MPRFESATAIANTDRRPAIGPAQTWRDYRTNAIQRPLILCLTSFAGATKHIPRVAEPVSMSDTPSDGESHAHDVER
jgi:hypothetical protein